MNRNFYLFGIFLTGLCIAIAIFQGIIQFQQGAGIFFRQSFLHWAVLVVILNLAGTFILLKYYRYKKYELAFSTGIIVAIAFVSHFIVVYSMLLGKQWGVYFTTTYLSILATTILNALSLVFSRAGERRWLKAAGVSAFILGLALMLTFIWLMNSQSFHLSATLEAIHRWIAMAGSVILVLHIMNFLSELKVVDLEKRNRKPQGSRDVLMITAAITAMAAILYLGVNLVTNKRFGVLGQNKEATYNADRIASPFEARSYVNNQGDTLPYRLMKPLDYDPQRKYPLMVCLHHGGTHGTDNIIQVEGAGFAGILSEEKNRIKYPAFIFVPQCPVGSYWGGVRNYPEVAPLVFEAIGKLEEEFSIDEKRRYVAGTSGGGFGSWHFICARPEMFAAAIPICGGGDPELAGSIVNVPVWAFHGEKDENVPVGFSRDMIEGIKNEGGNPKYTEFPGAGHNIWNEVIETPGVLDWLFEQERGK